MIIDKLGLNEFIISSDAGLSNEDNRRYNITNIFRVSDESYSLKVEKIKRILVDGLPRLSGIFDNLFIRGRKLFIKLVGIRIIHLIYFQRPAFIIIV